MGCVHTIAGDPNDRNGISGAALEIDDRSRRGVLVRDQESCSVRGEVELLRITPNADSLAVLPFKPLLPDRRNPAVELGMPDTLVTQLSKLPDVKISPLSSIRPYDAVDQDPLTAGRTSERSRSQLMLRK